MLTEMIMHDCIRRLLKQESDEENLECLCVLLRTIGKNMDTPKQAKEMKQHFDVLSELVKKQKTMIIHDCIRRLLKHETNEETLDGLCRLFTRIGKKIDTTKQAEEIKQYFDVLSKIEKQKVSSRIRFMILDVIELRQVSV